MASPRSTMSNPNIALRVSEIIDETIHAASSGSPETSENNLTNLKIDIEGEDSPDDIDKKARKVMKAAAENCLLHLLHHYDNFPPVSGPARINSVLCDPGEDRPDSDAHHYFALKDKSIITIIDLPKENACRLIIRDITGKYGWEVLPFFHDIKEVEKSDQDSNVSISVREKFALTPAIGSPQSIINGMLSLRTLNSSHKSEASMIRESDPLENLIAYIETKHPECYIKKFQSLIPDDLEVGKELASRIESHVRFEEKNNHDLQIKRKKGIQIYHKLAAPQQPDGEKYARFQTARLFLNQMGYFSFDNLKDGNLMLLAKSQNLIRDIKGLDKKFSREVVKLALIYVGPGQEEESSLLKNDIGSADYQEFVASLGWLVDLNTHGGYKGGLEANMMFEGMATYFCTSTLEIIFHDVTRMLTDPSDSKQLKKKRHIGNS